MITYEEIGRIIGAIVDNKNKAYGSSFEHAGEVLKILYPAGIEPDQYQDMLYMARVIDKLFRIATDKDAYGENPASDIAGYSILKAKESMEGAEIGERGVKQIAQQVGDLEN